VIVKREEFFHGYPFDFKKFIVLFTDFLHRFFAQIFCFIMHDRKLYQKHKLKSFLDVGCWMLDAGCRMLDAGRLPQCEILIWRRN